MQATREAVRDDIEIVPVVVLTRVFPARPSAIPDIRDFVREQLAQTPLSTDTIRSLDWRVADVLLDAAGPGGTIQVSLRILPDSAEVDVLEAPPDLRPTMQPELAGNTVPVASSPVLPPSPSAAPSHVALSGEVRQRPVGTFAEWLADALRREGMTMESAARQLQVSVKTVSRWVRGATQPRLCDLSRIRELFGELPFP